MNKTKSKKILFLIVIFLIISFLPNIVIAKTNSLKSSNIIKQLQEQAGECYSKGKYFQAETLLTNALSIIEKSSPQNFSEKANVLSCLSAVYLVQEKYEKAEPLLKKSLSKLIKKHSTNHPSTSSALENLALLYYYQGNYSNAIPLFNKALKFNESYYTNNYSRIANTLNNLAAIYLDQGYFSKSATIFKQIYSNLKKEENCDYALLTSCIDNLATVYRKQGEYDKAEQFISDNLKILLRKFGNNHPMQPQFQYALAKIHQEKNEYTEAENLYTAALRDFPDNPTFLIGLAGLYHIQGKYIEAENFYIRSLNLFEKKDVHSNYLMAQALNKLGLLYIDKKEFDKAELNLTKAINLMDKTFGRGHPEAAGFGINLGLIHLQNNFLKKAEKTLTNSIKILSEVYGTNHLYVASGYNDLGCVYLKDKKLLKAEILFLKAFEIRKQILGKGHFLTAETFTKLGELNILKRKSDVAAEYFENALAALETTAETIGSEDYSERIRENQNSICGKYLAVLSKFPSNQFSVCGEKSFKAMELSRARFFLEQLSIATANRLGKLTDEDRKKESKILSKIKALEEQKKEEHSKKIKNFALLRKLEIKLNDLRNQRAVCKSDFIKKYPKFMKLRSSTPVKLKEFQTKILKIGEVFISYWEGENFLYANVVTKEKTQFLSHRIDKKKLYENLRKFYSSIAAPSNNLEQFKESSSYLYSELFEPFLKNIKIDSTLYIAPHGPLGAIPFEALITSTQGKTFSELDYLFKKVSIAYAPSATVLQAIREASANGRFSDTKRHPCLLVGNPTTIGCINPLPGTEKEIKNISKIFYNNVTNKHILLKTCASEENIKLLSRSDKLSNYRYVHFAAHVFLPGELSEISEPCIALTPSNVGNEDGFLKMSEVFGLEMNADLVILSACNTGFIETSEEIDGVSGLSRAFFFAGSPTLEVTLWEIDDFGTTEFMKNFYSELKKNEKSPIKALNKAKIKMIEKKSYLSHPYYWAGFVLIGESEKK